MEHWRVILEGVAANPDQRLWEIPLLTAPEQRQMLHEWNRTERNYPQNLCLHDLFEAQARRVPDAVALEFEGNRLTYRELDARAGQAVPVPSRGSAWDRMSRWGLARSVLLELFVGMLGILKACGAYVPLDPNYPRERIDFILEDAGATVLVTQRSLCP